MNDKSIRELAIEKALKFSDERLLKIFIFMAGMEAEQNLASSAPIKSTA